MLAVQPRVRGARVNIVKQDHPSWLDDASSTQYEQVTLVEWLEMIQQNQVN
jgi:hypothetical protein